MKKRNIIIAIIAVIVVVAIAVTIWIISSKYKTSGLNPANPATASERTPAVRGTLSVSSETASAGDEVKVKVSIKDNPGILGMTLSVNYVTGALTLTDAESGEAVKDILTFTKPGKLQNNCRFLWDGMELSEDQIKDGDVLILTFKVNEEAQAGDYPILLTYGQDEIVDRDLAIIDLDVVDGNVTVK